MSPGPLVIIMDLARMFPKYMGWYGKILVLKEKNNKNWRYW